MNMHLIGAFAAGLFFMGSTWAKLAFAFLGGMATIKYKDTLLRVVQEGIKRVAAHGVEKEPADHEEQKDCRLNVEEIYKLLNDKIDQRFDRIERAYIYKQLGVIRCPYCDHWTNINTRAGEEGCEFCGRLIKK